MQGLFSPGGNFLYAPGQHLQAGAVGGVFGVMMWRVGSSRLELADIIGDLLSGGPEKRREIDEDNAPHQITFARWLQLHHDANQGIERLFVTVATDRSMRVYV